MLLKPCVVNIGKGCLALAGRFKKFTEFSNSKTIEALVFSGLETFQKRRAELNLLLA